MRLFRGVAKKILGNFVLGEARFPAISGMIVFTAGPETYQVTGPVLDIKGDVNTVQKGTDRWEIALDKTAKVTGDLKVGAKVTI